VASCRSYAYQVGSALKFLHDNGCYHLDIKGKSHGFCVMPKA
jgi:serine/threonine protein kinase